MFHLFRALAERVKALFLTHAALDFEAEFLARDAERKAELLRQAARYEEEGLSSVARQLRQQAESVDSQRPLAIVLPAVEHLQSEVQARPLLLPEIADSTPANPQASASPCPRKKGRKS
jgi:hypothetical protein